MSRMPAPIDPAAGRPVANSISEKLRQTLASEPRMPDRLQQLLNQLRQNEKAGQREGRDSG